MTRLDSLCDTQSTTSAAGPAHVVTKLVLFLPSLSKMICHGPGVYASHSLSRLCKAFWARRTARANVRYSEGRRMTACVPLADMTEHSGNTASDWVMLKFRGYSHSRRPIPPTARPDADHLLAVTAQAKLLQLSR